MAHRLGECKGGRDGSKEYYCRHHFQGRCNERKAETTVWENAGKIDALSQRFFLLRAERSVMLESSARSSSKEEKEEFDRKYQDYFRFSSPFRFLKAHQVLLMMSLYVS